MGVMGNVICNGSMSAMCNGLMCNIVMVMWYESVFILKLNDFVLNNVLARAWKLEILVNI